MSEDSFRLQLSVKVDGQHLLNIRAATAEEFGALIRSTVDDAELIQSACRALEGVVQKPEPARPNIGPHPNLVPSHKTTSPEYGPTVIDGVSTSTTKRDGTPMKSPKYTVKFAGGKSYSTFEGLIGKAAESLAGKPVYYTLETKGEYTNLASVRSAA